jgi:hypothetical protein
MIAVSHAISLLLCMIVSHSAEEEPEPWPMYAKVLAGLVAVLAIVLAWYLMASN